jgi:hypothetical protein
VPIVVLYWSAVGALLYYYYRVKSPEKIAAIGSFASDAESIPERADAAAARIDDGEAGAPRERA